VAAVRKLAVLATHPVQYQCPLWATLADKPAVLLKVFFGSDFSIRGYSDGGFGRRIQWGQQLLAGFDYAFTGNAAWHPVFLRASKRLYAELEAYQPTDLLLNAYVPLFYWQGLRWARKNGVRVLFRGDTTDSDRDRGPGTRLARNLILDLFYSRVDVFCAVGLHSRAHYLDRGIEPRRIRESPFCVDSVAFEKQFERSRWRRGELRGSLGLKKSDFVLVFSGKLISKKDPLTLIHAVSGLPSVNSRPLKLVIMGDGPLRQQCKSLATADCGGRVLFLGFKGQDDLGDVYGAADALVLPSIQSETWGLVVNEALQFGLPCIVSDRVGCKDDLVLQGVTGETFPHGDIKGLRAAIVRLGLWLDGRRAQVADQCRRAVSGYSLDSAASGIVDALMDDHG